MNPALAGVALAILIGAIVAASSRDARIATLGMAVVAVGSPILADPIASPLGLAARIVAALLATYLLWIAVRDGGAPTGGSRIGWAAEASVAAAAAIVGYGTHGLGVAGSGPALGQAVGFALAALAMAPLVTGRDTIRIGMGLLLLTHGSLLVRVALGGTPSPLEELVTAGFIAGLGGVVAVLSTAARWDGSDGGFALAAPGGPDRTTHAPPRPDRRRPRPAAESLPLWTGDAFPTSDASSSNDPFPVDEP